MTSTLANNSATPQKHSIQLFLTLIIAGLLGNYFSYPIFLNVYFLFGSIFAMLALQFFGLSRGIVAGAIIASYTYVLCNHPYAICIMTAEIAVVGLLMERRRMGMVQATTIYWLVVGMPMGYLFYHIAMHIPLSSTYITMTKQGMNGIANALVARLIFSGYSLRTKSTNISYRELIYNLLAFFVLCPTIILLVIDSRHDFLTIDQSIRYSLKQNISNGSQRLETWLANRNTTTVLLAKMATTRTPQQMQPVLEQAVKSDLNFLRIGMQNKYATMVAYFPLIDELGHINVGKIFADRYYYPILKRTLKPILSEVLMGKIGIQKPFVAMFVPVVIHGAYGGCISSVMNLEKVWEYLVVSAGSGSVFTLLDQTGNVIMTSRTDQKVMTPFHRNKGTFSHIDNHISQWIPYITSDTSASERWDNSFYVAETSIGELAEWRLILELPVAPFQKAIYDNYTDKFLILFAILIGALVLAEFLSRRVVVTLDLLRKTTNELPVKLSLNITNIEYPSSGIVEVNQLVTNFKELVETLSKQRQKIELKIAQMDLVQKMAKIGYWSYNITSDSHVWSDMMFTIFNCSMSNGPPSYKDRRTHIHPDDWHKYESSVQSCLAGNPYNIVIRVALATGDIRLVNTQGYPQFSSEGDITSLFGVSQDVTERMLAEDRFELLYHRFQLAISSANFGVWDWNVQQNIMIWDDRMFELYGVSREGTPNNVDAWINGLHPEDRESAIAKSQLALSGEQVFDTVFRIMHPDGTVRYIKANALVIFGTNGTAERMIGINADITEHRLLEEALQRSHDELEQQVEERTSKLQESEKRYKSLFTLASEGIIIMSLDGKLIEVNESFALMHGNRPDEMLGLTVGQLENTFDSQISSERMQRALAGESLTFEVEHFHKDGHIFPVEVFTSLITLKDGAYILGLHRDISERRRAEEALLLAKNKAESANRAKSEFLANMSHEIRTPMNGLLGMAQLLELTELSEEQQQYVSALKQSSKNLLLLINDILDLSKIEAGKITIESYEFSLIQSIKDIVTMQKQVACEKGLSLDIDISMNIPPVLIGDQLRIKQILQNLLGNAIKFTAGGGITVTVKLLEQHDDLVLIEISICDTGIGISPEALEYIFMPFVQEDGSTTRRFGGTGLGLTISRRLSELMGGSISLESTLGEGSCFRLNLPLPIAKDTSSHYDSTIQINTRWEGLPLKLLFIEDDPTSAKFGVSLLRKMGHTVIAADNGQKCLAILKQHKFDLVFMDIQMPVMNGEEAIKAIREREQGTVIHQMVIALTAYSLRGDKEQFMESGFDGYLSKPLESTELISEIKRVIELFRDTGNSAIEVSHA